jgi:hypothetical protein
MKFPSLLEREVYGWLDLHPVTRMLGAQYWATEVAAFPGLGNHLAHCKVDLVIFNGLSAARENMQRGLLVFLDGHGHFPSRYTTQGCDVDAAFQRQIDRRISEDAAKAGFHILRVAAMDRFFFLSMLREAWNKVLQSSSGWVVVSRSWNSGTHRYIVKIV